MTKRVAKVGLAALEFWWVQVHLRGVGVGKFTLGRGRLGCGSWRSPQREQLVSLRVTKRANISNIFPKVILNGEADASDEDLLPTPHTEPRRRQQHRVVHDFGISLSCFA